MNNDWITKPLGELCDFTNGGAWPATSYAEEGVPVVRVTDIQDGTVDLSKCKFLPKSLFSKYAQHQLFEGDVVICTVGSHPTQPGSVVGRTAIMPSFVAGALLNQNAVRLRTANSLLLQGWLSYVAKSDSFRAYIIGCARGSANQVRMSIGLLKQLPMPLPPITYQKRVSAILSGYDSLIENNTRRIAILEEMARLIYREWFVNFRFPGHEKMKFVDSELGRIPVGWSAKPLSNLIDFAKGKKTVQVSGKQREGDVPVLLIDYLRGGAVQYCPKQNNVLAESDDTVMVMDGASSCEVFIGWEGCVGSTLGRIRSLKRESFSPFMLFEFLRGRMGEFASKNIGAAIPHANKEYIFQQYLALPTPEVTSKFEEIVRPMRRSIMNLKSQVSILKATRDLLLPRLISGEIDVSELEIAIPEKTGA